MFAGAVFLVIGVLALVFVVSPVSLHRVRPGEDYRSGTRPRTVPILTLPSKPIYFLKPRVLGDMLVVTKFVEELLRRAEIDYWITCGALLGAVRHAGFTPWDDDIDINIKLEDVPRLTALESEISAAGFRLLPARGGFKIGRRNWLTAYPYVDVVVVAPRDGKLSPCYPLRPDGECSFEVADQWPGECLPEELVYPLSRVEMEGVSVSCPSKPLEAVEFLYGPTALKQVPYGGYPWFPWIDNHYTDNIAFRLGIIPG